MKKRIIKYTNKFLRVIFLWVRILKLLNILRRFKSILFSSIISNEFKSCGDNLSIFCPFYITGQKNITIGSNFNSLKGLRLEAYTTHLNHVFTPNLIIGNNVSVNFDCHITCINKLIIEDDVLIASNVFITDHFHGEINSSAIDFPPAQRKLFSKGPVIIEQGTWIGEGVVIMPNVTIGKFSIIGANSVVTKSFPAYSVIGGNPAVLIKLLL